MRASEPRISIISAIPFFVIGDIADVESKIKSGRLKIIVIEPVPIRLRHLGLSLGKTGWMNS